MLSLGQYQGEELVGVRSDFFTQGGILLYVINIELNKSGVQKLDTYQSQSEYMKDFVYLKTVVGKTIEVEQQTQPIAQSFDLCRMRMA